MPIISDIFDRVIIKQRVLNEARNHAVSVINSLKEGNKVKYLNRVWGLRLRKSKVGDERVPW